jgi:HlyD family secretion protein
LGQSNCGSTEDMMNEPDGMQARTDATGAAADAQVAAPNAAAGAVNQDPTAASRKIATASSSPLVDMVPGDSTPLKSIPLEPPLNLMPAEIAKQTLPVHTGAVVPLPRQRRTRWLWIILLLLLGAGAGGGYYWWTLHQFHLPSGFAYGNGRLEADPIDIDTKFAGRIAQILVDEGDRVRPGQVVARMDTRDLEASLRALIAQKAQVEHSLDEARALVVQQKTQVTLAEKELARTQALVDKGYATHELFDQRRQSLDGANAALTAANQRVVAAEHAVAIVVHNIELSEVNIADNTLVAPKEGRIEYRVANVGEVLAAGGKVYTMLDLSYVYMDIYLPTIDAGRAAIGDDVRIILDAFPKLALPGRVTYIATEAQFTPKTVETQSERDKLMFRIRARIDPALLKDHLDQIRTGLPGVTYVRLDSKAKWPPELDHRPNP